MTKVIAQAFEVLENYGASDSNLLNLCLCNLNAWYEDSLTGFSCFGKLRGRDDGWLGRDVLARVLFLVSSVFGLLQSAKRSGLTAKL